MMKPRPDRFYAGLLLMAAVAFSQAACADVSLGHIDFEALIKMMPGYADAHKALDRHDRELASRLEGMQSELKRKLDSYSKEESQLPDSVKVLRLQEIRDLDNRVDDFAASAEGSYQLKQRELLEPILEKAKRTVARIAQTRGFVYVFDSKDPLLLYAAESHDMFPLVTSKLGVR